MPPIYSSTASNERGVADANLQHTIMYLQQIPELQRELAEYKRKEQDWKEEQIGNLKEISKLKGTIIDLLTGNGSLSREEIEGLLNESHEDDSVQVRVHMLCSLLKDNGADFKTYGNKKKIANVVAKMLSINDKTAYEYVKNYDCTDVSECYKREASEYNELLREIGCSLRLPE